MYFVYILRSLKDQSLYIGFSESLTERVKYHRKGSVASTKNKRPMKLVWYCRFSEKQKALAFEKYLKSGSGIAFLNKRLV